MTLCVTWEQGLAVWSNGELLTVKGDGITDEAAKKLLTESLAAPLRRGVEDVEEFEPGKPGHARAVFESLPSATVTGDE